MRFPSRGFTLIEVLIVAFVLSVVTLAITGLSLVLTRSAIESERATVAQGLLNEKLENLRAAYNELGYEVIEYTDISPLGMVEREETVGRNSLDYEVEGHIFYIDDPANGTLPEGTPVTRYNADFAQVLYKASWTSNIGAAPGVIPSAHAAPSSVVSSATFFLNVVREVTCTPGTQTCKNPDLDCSPGAQCSDGSLCSPSGVCPGSSTEPFVECPADGKCPKKGQAPGALQQPPSQSQCPNGINTVGNTLEVCDLSVCNDGQDNDGGNDPDLLDPQCQEGALNLAKGKGNFLYVPLTGCIRNEATCGITDRGLQKFGRLGTIASYNACSAQLSCGVVEHVWFACETECSDLANNDGFQGPDSADPECHSDGDVNNRDSYTPSHRSENDRTPECDNGIDDDNAQGTDYSADPSCDSSDDDDEFCPFDSQNSCQEKHSCDQGSFCVAPLPHGGSCTGQNCCPDTKAMCGNGFCWECLANQAPSKQACNLAAKADPERGNGEDGWCSGGKDGLCVCEPGTNKCVQCLNNDNCGRDRPWCVGGTCQEEPACSDTKDNDRDQKIDFVGTFDRPPDPGCTDPGDNDERDHILPPPEPARPACSDGADNDGDQLIDFPDDPGCDDGADLSEEEGPPLFSPPPEAVD